MAALAAIALAAAGAAASAAPPQRVVSMNVCTDQLAMLIASPGQLHSVSYMAADPGVSVLSDQAGRYAVNHGLAEEVFLMRPDLVLAGTFSTRAPVALLRRLGFRVEEFAPEDSFDDIRANLRRMGELLGRTERAAELIAALDAGLAELAQKAPADAAVALYYANSHTSGMGTLADAVVGAAGLTNIAASLGLSGTAKLPLELLVASRPALIAGGERRPDSPAQAEQNFIHPAYAALAAQVPSVPLPGRYTVCGAPFTLEAARILRRAVTQPAMMKP